MKNMEDIKSEASSENESAQEEASEYGHIDDFIKTLDKEELVYLKECLTKADKNPSLEDVENAEEAHKEKDKEISMEDFENDEE